MKQFANDFLSIFKYRMRTPYVIRHAGLQDKEYYTFEELLWHYFLHTYPKYEVSINGDSVCVRVETETDEDYPIDAWNEDIKKINSVVQERHQDQFPGIKLTSPGINIILITISYEAAMEVKRETNRAKEKKKQERIEKEQRKIEERHKERQGKRITNNRITSYNNHTYNITEDAIHSGFWENIIRFGCSI